MFILGVVVLISGFGYLGYIAVQKRREKEFETPVSRGVPRQQIQRQIPVQFTPPRETRPAIQPRLQVSKEKELLKDMERKKLFETFGKDTKEQPAATAIQQGAKEKKEGKLIKKKGTRKTTAKKTIQPKTKEDAFAKLKDMAREAKKKK